MPASIIRFEQDVEQETAEASIGQKERITTCEQTYIVQTDEPVSCYQLGNMIKEDPYFVFLGQSFDPVGEPGYLTIRDIKISRKAESLFFVMLSFSTEALNFEQQQAMESEEFDNPLAWPVKIDGDTYQKTQAAVEDINGEAVLNSAGDYPDPPPTEEWDQQIFSFSKNFSSLPSWYFTHQNSLNSDEITIKGNVFPTKHCALRNVRFKEAKSKVGTTYLEVSWEIHTDSNDPLTLKFLDEGLRRRDGTNRVSITEGDIDPTLTGDEATQKVSAPVMLDGAGDVLADPSPANAEFNSYDLKYLRAYGSLPGVNGNT